MSQPPVVLYGRFPFAALSLFVGPLLIVLSVATYVFATTNSNAVTLAAQIACAITGFTLVVMLPGVVILAVSLRRPALELTASGSRLKNIMLHWDDVASIDMRRHFGQRYVALTLRDPESFLKKLPSYVASAYYRQLRLGRNSILIPKVRGRSIQQLRDLFQEYWKKGLTAEHETADSRSTTYFPYTASETAAALASSVFGVFLFFRWIDLVGCLRAGNVACMLENAAYAAGAAGATYLVSLLILRRIKRAHPGFDLWQKLAIPQDLVGGIDTTRLGALGSPQVRREPYITRLQKAPWRIPLYGALIGGGGLLLGTGQLFFGLCLIEPGSPSSRIAEAFATARTGWLIALVLIIANAATALIAFLNLKYSGKAETHSSAP